MNAYDSPKVQEAIAAHLARPSAMPASVAALWIMDNYSRRNGGGITQTEADALVASCPSQGDYLNDINLGEWVESSGRYV